MYACIYICIYIYMYICIHICSYTYLSIIFLRPLRSEGAYPPKRISPSLTLSIYVYNIDIYYILMYLFFYIYIYMCVYIHICIHYMYTYISINFLRPLRSENAFIPKRISPTLTPTWPNFPTRFYSRG